jgi:hypothetical protein
MLTTKPGIGKARKVREGATAPGVYASRDDAVLEPEAAPDPAAARWKAAVDAKLSADAAAKAALPSEPVAPTAPPRETLLREYVGILLHGGSPVRALEILAALKPTDFDCPHCHRRVSLPDLSGQPDTDRAFIDAYKSAQAAAAAADKAVIDAQAKLARAEQAYCDLGERGLNTDYTKEQRDAAQRAWMLAGNVAGDRRSAVTNLQRGPQAELLRFLPPD